MKAPAIKLALTALLCLSANVFGQDRQVFISENYENWKASHEIKNSTGSKAGGVYVGNDFVGANVNSDGRFTVQTSDGRRLLYWASDPFNSSSATLVYIDGVLYSNNYEWFGEYVAIVDMDPYLSLTSYASGNNVITTWNINGILIKQVVRPVQNSETGSVEFSIEIVNSTTSYHTIGVMLQFDTMIDNNDGAPLKTSFGTIDVETGFYAPNIPEQWQAYQSPVYDPNYLIGKGVLKGGNTTPPDVFIAGYWPNLGLAGWDFVPTGVGYNDSAVLTKWKEKGMNPGQSASYTTHYGLGSALQTEDELRINYPSETIELTVREGQLSPNPFEVNLFLLNNTGQMINNIQAEIFLPEGLSLAEDITNPRYINPWDLQNSQEGYVSFKIAAEPSDVSTTKEFIVRVSSDQLPAQDLTMQVYIPAVKEFEMEALRFLDQQQVFHKTYEYVDLVFRRALPLQFIIDYSGFYDKNANSLEFELVHYNVNGQIDWRISDYQFRQNIQSDNDISGEQEGKLYFAYVLPNDLYLGKYKIICRSEGREVQSESFYVVFNPFWGARDDYYDQDVFNPDVTLSEEELEAFVLSNDIYIYVNYNLSEIKKSNFSRHFENTVFQLLMDKFGNYEQGKTNDARYISREISTLCSQILRGYWPLDRDFSCPSSIPDCDAHEPWAWTSAPQIINNYYEHEQARYGQCFTFAQLSTSLLRSVGIPAKPVGNAGDGVDNGGQNGTPDNKVYLYAYEDKQWNYHEWTEVWLPYEYKNNTYGWCAIDATLERSHREDRSYCGPAPLMRVKDNINSHGDDWHDEGYFYSHVNDPIYRESYSWLTRDMVFKKTEDFASQGMRTYSPHHPNNQQDRLIDYIDPKYEKDIKGSKSGQMNSGFLKEKYYWGDPVEIFYEINNDAAPDNAFYYSLDFMDVSNASGGGGDPVIISDTSGIVRLSSGSTFTETLVINPEEKLRPGHYAYDYLVADSIDDGVQTEQGHISIEGVLIDIADLNPMNASDTGEISIELMNPLSFELSDLQVRINIDDELLALDETSFQLAAIDPLSSSVHPFSVSSLPLADGTYNMTVSVYSGSILLGESFAEIIIRGESRLLPSLSTSGNATIGEEQLVSLTIENIGGQAAEDVPVSFMIPDFYLEHAADYDSLLTIPGASTITVEFSLTPIRFGSPEIISTIIFDGDTITLSSFSNISSFPHTIDLTTESEFVYTTVPQMVELKLTNNGLYNDIIEISELVSDIGILTTLIFNGEEVTGGQIEIGPDTTVSVFIEVITHEFIEGEILIQVTSIYDENASGSIELLVNQFLVPEALKASDGTYRDRIEVNWKATQQDSYYRIYRSTINHRYSAVAISAWSADTVFFDTTAVAGQTYYYYVQSAMDEAGIYSSGLSEANPGHLLDLQPVVPEASDGDSYSMIAISWEDPGEEQYFMVLRQDGEGQEDYTEISPWLFNQFTYTDETAIPGITYYYYIKSSIDTIGIINARISTYDAGHILVLPAPEGLVVSQGDYGDGVEIIWQQVEGATVYKVYRSDINYESSLAELHSNWISDTSYYDSTVPFTDIDYYYAVRSALDETGFNESAFSSLVSGFATGVAPGSIGYGQGPAVYPNPFKEEVHIELNGVGNEKHTLVVMDVSGRIICEEELSGQQKHTMETAAWSEGLYIIKLTGRQSNVFSLIKMK